MNEAEFLRRYADDEGLVPLGKMLEAIRFGIVVIPKKQQDEAKAACARVQDYADGLVMRETQRRAMKTMSSIERHLRAARVRATERIALLREMDADAAEVEAESEIIKMLDEEITTTQTMLVEVERL